MTVPAIFALPDKPVRPISPTTTNALKPGPNAGNVNGTSFVFKIDPTVAGSGSLVYSSYLGGTQGVFEFARRNRHGQKRIGLCRGAHRLPARYRAGELSGDRGHRLSTHRTSAIATGTGFLSKLDTTQSGAASLIYSTYLGGNGAHAANHLDLALAIRGFGVAEDSSGNTYVTGTTASTDFPTTTGTAFQPTLTAGNTGGAAFVSRFDTTKAGQPSLVYSTYLGGEAADFANAIALGPSNVAYVTGFTKSLLFRTTPGAFQTTGNGAGITFISLIDTSLTGAASLKYSTFVSGSRTNTAFGIATDTSGNAYVVGATDGSDFPVTKGSFQRAPAIGSQGEGFVTKLNPGGMGAADLVYSTYFGGSGNAGNFDEVNAIAVVPVTNNAAHRRCDGLICRYISGCTQPRRFPDRAQWPSDAFVAELTFQPTLTVSP